MAPLALVFVVQLRAVERGEHLALLDRLAGAHRVGDGAGGDGEQGRIDGGDDRTLGRHVTHEVPAVHGGDAQPLARDHLAAVQPGHDEPRQQEQQRERGTGCVPHPVALPVGRGVRDGGVLRLRAAHHRGVALCLRQLSQVSKFHVPQVLHALCQSTRCVRWSAQAPESTQ